MQDLDHFCSSHYRKNKQRFSEKIILVDIRQHRIISKTSCFAAVPGYLFIEVIITLSLISILMISSLSAYTSLLTSFQHQFSCLALFSSLQFGQALSKARDQDTIFQVSDNSLKMISPTPSTIWTSFKTETLTLSNASGIGFTESGHTKYAGTLRINLMDSPAVSLGIGYGKVTLK